MDRAGWNVVADRDFASPHLSRVVRTGDEALRGRTETGVVMSGPLTTASPSRQRPTQELERVFRDAGRTAPRDLTPIMARDDSLRAEDALRLVNPTTRADVSRRSASPAADVAPVGGPTAAGRSTDVPLTTRTGSPLHTGSRSTDDSYRSYQGRRSAPGGREISTERNPFVPRSRPSTSVVPDAGGRPSIGGREIPMRSTGSTSRTIQQRQPTTRSAPSIGGRSGSSATRPVIVPRTNPTAPRASSGTRSAPSRNPTASSAPRSSRSRSSAGRAPSRSVGSRSSAGRSGGGRSAAPRSAPSAPRSSGGARRR
jgi:hypothetical protein